MVKSFVCKINFKMEEKQTGRPLRGLLRRSKKIVTEAKVLAEEMKKTFIHILKLRHNRILMDLNVNIKKRSQGRLFSFQNKLGEL